MFTVAPRFEHSRCASAYAEPFALALPPAPGDAVAVTVYVSGPDWNTPEVDAQPAIKVAAIIEMLFKLISELKSPCDNSARLINHATNDAALPAFYADRTMIRM